MVPLPERYGDLKKIQAAIKTKSEYDPTIDDDEDDEASEFTRNIRAAGIPDGIASRATLFGDTPSEAKAAAVAMASVPSVTKTTPSDAPSEQNPGSGIEMPQQPALSLSAKPSSSKPKKTNLQAVLRSLQAQSRRQSQPRSGKLRELPYDSFGGGEGGDDMEF